MAKEQKEGLERRSDEAAKPKPPVAPRQPTIYAVRRGETINGHVCGVAIRNGVGRTSDVTAARRCAEAGCQVTAVDD